MSSPHLILASTSSYRAELLSRLEIPFDCAAPPYDESASADLWGELAPRDFALHLARGKAQSLRDTHGQAWLLAADQIAVLAGDANSARLLGKPGTEERAVDQLCLLAGHTHELITAVVLLAPDGAESIAYDHHHLTMRSFPRAEAQRYVQRHKPLDCAGSYRIEDAGIALFERIEGEDFTGIIGLPLLATARLLRTAGLLA